MSVKVEDLGDGVERRASTSSGPITWYCDGRMHRDDGPAVEYPNGDRWWMSHGVFHRLDGLAQRFGNGSAPIWWVLGRQLTVDETGLWTAVPLSDRELVGALWVAGTPRADAVAAARRLA